MTLYAVGDVNCFGTVISNATDGHTVMCFYVTLASVARRGRTYFSPDVEKNAELPARYDSSRVT